MSKKRLRSVAQSLAHHAQSGLCYVHPRLGEVCKPLGLKYIAVNLLRPGFEPDLENPSREIVLSTEALRSKFREILSAEGETNTFKSAKVVFQFLGRNWPSAAFVQIVTESGDEIEMAVGSDGQRAQIISSHS
ncbi:MAG: hypothetical protein AAF358_23785 [Pseudomonadota bacterium]